jgi:hypothetical protein
MISSLHCRYKHSTRCPSRSIYHSTIIQAGLAASPSTSAAMHFSASLFAVIAITTSTATASPKHQLNKYESCTDFGAEWCNDGDAIKHLSPTTVGSKARKSHALLSDKPTSSKSASTTESSGAVMGRFWYARKWRLLTKAARRVRTRNVPQRRREVWEVGVMT